MARFDRVIRGGVIVDGSRLPRFRGDIGIKDGVIAEIGQLRADDADEVIDADGLIVAPGFVDLHTHYDAQLFWDPYCTLSSWHGITSVVIGNCGFGFAPVRPTERERAMLTMTRVEAIPMASMQQGMPWSWVTFPEFLDAVDRAPKALRADLAAADLGDGLRGGEGGQAADARAARRAAAAAERGDGRRRLRLVGPAHAADRAGGGAARP
jgi:N-acyl-D-aspartate/D-glutamate deacylase